MLSPCGRLKKRKGGSLLREAAANFEVRSLGRALRPARRDRLGKLASARAREGGGLWQCRWGSHAAGVPTVARLR